MEPSKIREATLEQLDQTFLEMHKAKWKLALKGKPKEIVDKAKKYLLDVEEARFELRNAQLADIQDKLIANEKALEDGRQQVSDTLRNLQQVDNVLNAVSSFLGVIARVVPLL